MPQKFSIENPDLLSACILCTCARFSLYNSLQLLFFGVFILKNLFLVQSNTLFGLKSDQTSLCLHICWDIQPKWRRYRVIRNFCTCSINHTVNDGCKKISSVKNIDIRHLLKIFAKTFPQKISINLLTNMAKI